MIGDVGNHSVENACKVLNARYQEALRRHDLSPATQVFSRIHLSDIANQKEAVRSSRLYSILSQGAVSMIEQAPLYEGMMSLHTYHVVPDCGGLQRSLLNHDPQAWRNGSLIRGANYQMLWTANYDGRGPFDAHAQTEDIFDAMGATMHAHAMSLRHNTVRTWVYVRDIDNHYLDMVKSRRALFRRLGLTDRTRYIASTGIEGKSNEVNTLASIDALSIGGLREEQIVRMEAPDHMPPTITYGVTFERGLRIRFGDRSHLCVSGTASIDQEGRVMHVGNVKKQTERTLENMAALLAPHEADLEDMAYVYVYVRDPGSRDTVREVVEQRVPPHVPVLYLRGAVCRPAWLVEMEGTARILDNAPFPNFL
jgi:enamine deaminase RidA (YjgF/YER057c/UK114 family)